MTDGIALELTQAFLQDCYISALAIKIWFENILKIDDVTEHPTIYEWMQKKWPNLNITK